MSHPTIDFPAHVKYFGRGERPPMSSLRSLIMLINFAKLHHFVTRVLHKDHLEITRQEVLPAMLDIDEEAIYTFAKYLEPVQAMGTKVDGLRGKLADQTFQTWNVRIPSSLLQSPHP